MRVNDVGTVTFKVSQVNEGKVGTEPAIGGDVGFHDCMAAIVLQVLKEEVN